MVDLAYTSSARMGDGSRSNIRTTRAFCQSSWAGIPAWADRPLAVLSVAVRKWLWPLTRVQGFACRRPRGDAAETLDTSTEELR